MRVERFVLVIICLLVGSANLTGQQVDLIGVAEISGHEVDKSGLTDELGEGLTNNMMGGISALEYLGRDNLFVALPDRGPLDGAVNWHCRFNVVEHHILVAFIL